MSVIEEEISLKLDDNQIRRRVTFVSDRVSFIMAVSFGVLILFFLLFNYINLELELAGSFYLLLIIIGAICFFSYITTNEEV